MFEKGITGTGEGNARDQSSFKNRKDFGSQLFYVMNSGKFLYAVKRAGNDCLK